MTQIIVFDWVLDFLIDEGFSAILTVLPITDRSDGFDLLMGNGGLKVGEP